MRVLFFIIKFSRDDGWAGSHLRTASAGQDGLRKVVIPLPVVLTEALSTIMPERGIKVGGT